MEKFKFYAPTKVYFGKDEEQRVGKILQEYHPKKVLIHYGGKSAIQSGLLDRVKKARAIAEAAIEVNNELGIHIVPEIMIPLVSIDKEFKFVKKKELTLFLLLVEEAF